MNSRPIETRPIRALARQSSYGTVPQCVNCFKDATVQALFETENTIVVQNYCLRCLADAKYWVPPMLNLAVTLPTGKLQKRILTVPDRRTDMVVCKTIAVIKTQQGWLRDYLDVVRFRLAACNAQKEWQSWLTERLSGGFALTSSWHNWTCERPLAFYQIAFVLTLAASS